MTSPLFLRRLSASLALAVAATTAAPHMALAAQARPATSQPPAPAPRAARPPSPPKSPDDVVFDEAATLDDDGVAAWIESANAVLTRTPADRTAAARKVAAHLAAGRVAEALIAYETWTKAAGREDYPLLRRHATTVLRRLHDAPTSDLRVQALEALARGGDASARTALADRVKESASTDAGPAQLSLARLGEARAVAAVAERARSGTGAARLSGVDALRGLPVTPQTVVALRETMALEDPVLQGAAAGLAGDLGAKELIPELRVLADTGRFIVPLQASCALVALGDAKGRAIVDQALASELPDVRLLAAQALRAAGAGDGWVAAVVPILKDPNPILRIQAAAMLIGIRRDDAMPVLTAAAADPNPVQRDEAMRVLVSDPHTPLGLLKSALIDGSPSVRLRAAAAIDARARAEIARAR